jgi:2'-5' RNA ligase
VRAFIAIQPPAALRAALYDATSPLRSLELPVRWVLADAMHLTLAFLGSIDEARVGPVVDAMGDAAAAHPALDLTLHGLGAFPRRGDARVVWIGVDAPPSLAALHEDLSVRLEKAGFAREARAFAPHLTLGRSRRDAQRVVLPDSSFEFRATFAVEELVLMRSHTDPAGARYEQIAATPLGALAGTER